MDASSIITPLLSTLLPPELVHWINLNILSPRSAFQIYKRHGLAHLHRLLAALYPIVRPLVDRALENEGLVSLVALLSLLVSAFLVVSWLHRLVMWWTRLALRAVFWGVVFAAAALAWQRGPAESLRDVVVVGGKLVGFLAAMKDVWVGEYEKYESQQKLGRGRGRSSGR